MIESVQGDLLGSNVAALVNPVNTVGVMGKGLALTFKDAYPNNFKAYVKACKQNQMSVGKMLVFDCGAFELPRYIINFPTKKHWRQPSKPEYISTGLQDLIEQIRILKIHSVAIPALGVGLGGLDWAVVKPLILEAFAALPEIQVLVFEPQEKNPNAREIERFG